MKWSNTANIPTAFSPVPEASLQIMKSRIADANIPLK